MAWSYRNDRDNSELRVESFPTGSGDLSSLILKPEILSGDIDGDNKVFTTANDIDNEQIAVFLNGNLQLPTTNFTVTDTNEITLDEAPQEGDNVAAIYVKATS